MAAFVYGIVPAAFEPPALDGLGDPPAPVRVVGAGDLGALVSDLPDDALPGTRDDLAAHARVLAAIVEAGATVVPVRFAMVLDDDEAVRERLLEGRREELVALLRALEDRVQYTLKAVYDEAALLREITAGNAEIAFLSGETRGRPDAEVQREKIRLGELVARAVEQQREADERAVAAPLDPVAERIVLESPRHDRIAVHAQILVGRARAAELEEAVGRLAEQHGGRMTFRLVGPLAPWSFSDVQLEAEEAWV
jgi:hypothetical protein